MEKQQREFLLRRQIDAIRKELGEYATTTSSPSTARASTSATLPEAVREAVARELDRLERTGEQNPEQGWIRTWLDTVLDAAVGHALRGRRSTSSPRARCSTPTTPVSTT